MKENKMQCIICGNVEGVPKETPVTMALVCEDCRNAIFYMKNYMAMMKFKATWRKDDENI